MSLGKNILKLRKQNGLSQEQLSDKLNVSRQTISNWEIGETSPNSNQLKLLSKELKVSIDELLDNDYVASPTNSQRPTDSTPPSSSDNSDDSVKSADSENSENEKSTATTQSTSVKESISSEESDSTTTPPKQPNQTTTQKKIATWQIILLILGAPLWLPLLIAAISIIVSLYIALLAIIISFWSIFIAIAITTSCMILAGITLIFTNLGLAGFAMLSIGIFCAGLSILLFFACAFLTKATLLLTKAIIKWIKNRFSRTGAAQ